jgi:hypothetical protein
MIRRSSALRFVLFAAIALVMALVFPRRAFAGTLQIRDEAHVLAPGDADRLRSQVASEPFDARLVFTSDYAEATDLSRFVGSLVDEPNMVVVGVDPRHRHVQVHFGIGSGIARTERPAIETAGTGDFRNGDWAGGAGAIFRTAAQSVTGGSSAQPAQPQGTRAPSSGFGSGLVWLLLIGGGIAAIAWLAFARRQAGYGAMGGPGGYSGGYGPGPYGGGYGPSSGGMGPVGGGIIGAGLGGLAGYELGKLEGERAERDRERIIEDDRGGAPDNNYDDGGGGSSWDDGGGDGGGSGWGDGGGDGGGGGSDF